MFLINIRQGFNEPKFHGLFILCSLILHCCCHDYYSIWFNLSAAFFKSEKKTGVIKLKTHFIHLVPCHEMLKS
jgi:hypothetical protein